MNEFNQTRSLAGLVTLLTTLKHDNKFREKIIIREDLWLHNCIYLIEYRQTTVS